MHTHLSLSYLDGDGNAFVDEADPYGLSRVARQFMAGLLYHARGMSSVFAPLINSYRRLVPGFEAPVYIGWANSNRSALIRVPAVRPHKRQSTRIELRCPDPSCNPYLTFAVMLACGLDGVENDLPLPEPVEENLYHLTEEDLARRNVGVLPATLGEAVTEMQQDPVVRAALGEHVFSHLVAAQKQRAGWDALSQASQPVGSATGIWNCTEPVATTVCVGRATLAVGTPPFAAGACGWGRARAGRLHPRDWSLGKSL
jgi:glutamine synthetase